MAGLKTHFFITFDRWGTGKCFVGTDITRCLLEEVPHTAALAMFAAVQAPFAGIGRAAELVALVQLLDVLAVDGLGPRLDRVRLPLAEAHSEVSHDEVHLLRRTCG